MKGNKIFVLIVAIVVVLAILVFVNFDRGEVVGGDRDKHGCLIGAGFSWNPPEQECVREWVLPDSEEQRYQVVDFKTCEDAGYPVGESYPRQCWTPSGRHFVEDIEGDPWDLDGISLAYVPESGGYACFGCGPDKDGMAICIDPAPTVQFIDETEDFRCDGFEVVRG